MARKKPATKVKKIADPAIAMTEYVAHALVATERLGIKTKAVEPFPLNELERATLADLPALPATLKRTLTNKNATFNVAETASMMLAVADSLVVELVQLKRLDLLHIAKKLFDCLDHIVVEPGLPTKRKKNPKPTDTVFQFKLTLLNTQPPIWRRIQVRDCTLDKLHEHIQTAMGWTNSHLHQFDIKGTRYGDPELLDAGFGDFECVDSTRTMLSEILPKTSKRLGFRYEYDFGDSWDHEVLFEGRLPVGPKAKYPVCLEGERACPPEDCGGAWSYTDFLKAIHNPKHEQHPEMLEWIGGRFDPEEFDPAVATKAMKKGLPDWR